MSDDAPPSAHGDRPPDGPDPAGGTAPPEPVARWHPGFTLHVGFVPVARRDAARIRELCPRPGSALSVWLSLCFMASEARGINVAVEIRHIAHRAAVSYRTAAAALQDLQKAGLLVIEHDRAATGRPEGASIYQLRPSARIAYPSSNTARENFRQRDDKGKTHKNGSSHLDKKPRHPRAAAADAAGAGGAKTEERGPRSAWFAGGRTP